MEYRSGHARKRRSYRRNPQRRHKMADGIVDIHQLRRQRLLNMTQERRSIFLIGT
jgi:hypothetical protein